MPEMFLDSLVCVYATACSSNDTYSKKRCVGWLDDSNTLFGLYRGNAGSYTQNDLLRTTAMVSTMFWQSFSIISPIFDEISSLQYLLLSFTGLKIDKSNIRRSLYPHLHLLLLFNICWNIPKRLIPLFRHLYDVMFTKLDPFVISFCPQNNPFFVQLSAIFSPKLIIMIKTKLLINPAKYSRCICPEMARYSILINVPQHKLRNLTASLCLTARLTVTRVQIW